MPAEVPPLHRVVGGAIGVAAIALAGYTVHTPSHGPATGSATSIAPGSGRVLEAMRPLMGTQFAIRVWAQPGREAAATVAIDATLERTAELEQRISSWRPDSDTSAVNRAAGQTAVPVGADLRELLTISMRWSRRTAGAFDVTGGPLFELWREARRLGTLPSATAIRDCLARVDRDGVEVREQSVRLRGPGMKLGFGSVAKGFAADRAAAELRTRGFEDFIIDAGGDLVVSGSRGAAPWNVGVRHPHDEQLLATAELSGCAIATSGDYEQYLSVDGQRFGHIIDPRTGWPVHEVTSVVVIAPSGADADALATGLSVLGLDAGLALAEKISSVEVLFVMADGRIHHSDGLTLNDGVLERIR